MCRLPPAAKGVTVWLGGTQAHEVMKLICGYGEAPSRRPWTTGLRTMQSYFIGL